MVKRGGGGGLISVIGAVGWWMYLVGAIVSCGVWRIGDAFSPAVTDFGATMYTSDAPSMEAAFEAVFHENDVNIVRVVTVVGLVAAVGAAVAAMLRRGSSSAVGALAALVVSFFLVEFAVNGFDQVDLRPLLDFVVLLIAVMLREVTWRRVTTPDVEPATG